MCCWTLKDTSIWLISYVILLVDLNRGIPLIWGTNLLFLLQNVASDFRPGKPLTSKSGTLAYLAPEVYEGGGYYCEVDWWSLGVTFYECIYNKVC